MDSEPIVGSNVHAENENEKIGSPVDENYGELSHEDSVRYNIASLHTLSDTANGDMSFTMTGQDDPTERVVTYNARFRVVGCTCQMLVTRGYFCRHILKVFYTLNVDSLPTQYMLKRWSKAAKHRAPKSWTSQQLDKDRGSNMIFKNQVMRIAYDLGLDIDENIPLQDVTLEKFRALANEIRTMKDQDPTVKRKRTRKASAKKKSGKKFTDPPIPNHGWLPCKRRSTVLDKQEARKGTHNMKKDSRNNKNNDQSQCEEVNASDSFIIALEDITETTPECNYTC